MARFLLSRALRRGPMPYPDDVPILHGSGPDPDRILLIGGGLVRGIGIRSNELGIAGNLARKLAASTGRGADVEAIGIEMLSARRAIEVLRTQNLARFDAVVLMLGNSEVLSGRPMRLWRRDIRTVLASIAQIAPDGPPMLIAASPPFSAAIDVAPILRRRVARGIARLNAETRRAVAESVVATFIDFDDAGPAPTVGSRAADAYESWATAMVVPVVNAIASATPLRDRTVPIDESARQRALDDLGIVGSEQQAVFDRIVEMARDMLGAPAASLTIIDRDRQWMVSARGIADDDIPRSESICDMTIQTPGVSLVEDAASTPQFRDASWVAGDEHIRAYAGYPLEAPGGQRVGCLCVMDRSPRHFTPDDVATLRDLALRAQRELWLVAAN
ncbi:MAG TPA: GAF domain-containing protein [Pseudolysinimonas sp.]